MSLVGGSVILWALGRGGWPWGVEVPPRHPGLVTKTSGAGVGPEKEKQRWRMLWEGWGAVPAYPPASSFHTRLLSPVSV